MKLDVDGAFSVAMALAVVNALDLKLDLALDLALDFVDNIERVLILGFTYNFERVPYSAGAERILIDLCVLLRPSFLRSSFIISLQVGIKLLINERSAWFGYNILFFNTLFVAGSFLFLFLNQCEIALNSYVCPPEVVTGSTIMSCVIGQINSFGKSIFNL